MFDYVFKIKQLLDYLLGHEHVALFRRAELKTLVNFHGNEVCVLQGLQILFFLPIFLLSSFMINYLYFHQQAGKGGELTHDETTIIAGALELSDKTASDAMTPISDTFTIDINAKLDRC